MATPRKRYSSKPQPEVSEKVSNISAELEKAAEEKDEVLPVVFDEPEPVFVEKSITPMPDPGPRFLDKEPPAPEPPTTQAPGVPLEQPPKRKHPRNVPKFSRYK